MRILFVYPDFSEFVTDYTGAVNFGVASMAAVLRNAGHHVELFHLLKPPAKEEYCKTVLAAKPDVVGFSFISHYARRLPAWTSWTREALPDALIVAGGVHATLAPEEVSAIPEVNCTCVGEGEETMLELCSARQNGSDFSRLTGLWVRSGSSILRNPARPFIGDLDSLPDPDLSIFNIPGLFTARTGEFTFIMSRGCVHHCSYCAAPAIRNRAHRQAGFRRFLSPQRAAQQIAASISRFMPDATMAVSSDTVFIPNKQWLREFTPLYRHYVGLPISCNMRAEMIDVEMADLLKDAGVCRVRMGVESGNEGMMNGLLRRNLSVADIRRAFALLRARSIQRWSYNIFGLPSETVPMMLDTVKLNADLDPDIAIPFIFYPYIGTELHEYCRSRGFLTDREFDTYFMGVVLKQPGISAGDVLFFHRTFKKLVRLYAVANRVAGSVLPGILDTIIGAPWFPRGGIAGMMEFYRRLRHYAAALLNRKTPAIYRLLGGTAPPH